MGKGDEITNTHHPKPSNVNYFLQYVLLIKKRYLPLHSQSQKVGWPIG